MASYNAFTAVSGPETRVPLTVPWNRSACVGRAGRGPHGGAANVAISAQPVAPLVACRSTERTCAAPLPAIDGCLSQRNAVVTSLARAECPSGPFANMDALLVALAALMALAAAMAAVLSTLSKAAIFAILAITPCIYRYRKRIYIIIKTLPRDTK
ncbi:hypothetical protein EVAR_13102_1 [Eumeta japonica]|uniref:Uncharacterized protein n=1 Tax=Eumeta variegata TaxID=151549 RepID=A0A4C1U9G7_EUMVA|nr:hypothetical protein EVAR_13102_1 [Eumeta japonica]